MLLVFVCYIRMWFMYGEFRFRKKKTIRRCKLIFSKSTRNFLCQISRIGKFFFYGFNVIKIFCKCVINLAGCGLAIPVLEGGWTIERVKLTFDWNMQICEFYKKLLFEEFRERWGILKKWSPHTKAIMSSIPLESHEPINRTKQQYSYTYGWSIL